MVIHRNFKSTARCRDKVNALSGGIVQTHQMNRLAVRRSLSGLNGKDHFFWKGKRRLDGGFSDEGGAS